MSPWELVLRGTIVYVGLILVVRFVLRRDVGAMGTADLLFVVLVADAAQNAMAGEYRTIADGAVLLGTLVAWNVALDGLAYHWPPFARLIEAPARPLVKDGKILRQNLRKDWVTVDELTSKLRQQGIDDLALVRVATLEPDGELSVIRVNESATASHSKRRVTV